LANLAKIEAFDAYAQVEKAGGLTFESDGAEITLSADEFDFEFDGKEGYVVAEKEGILTALLIARDSELIAEGVVRDVARRLQAMRKDKGYAATDILGKAVVASEDAEITSSLMKHKEELAYLVRVKTVDILSKPPEGVNGSWVDIDKVSVFITI
jgi:isoleucyl-tRNA synthetase